MRSSKVKLLLGALLVGWWTGVLWFVLKVLLVVAVFWLWIFFGSRNQCPSCGSSLEDELSDVPIVSTRVRDHCRCGWRRSQ